MKAIDFELSNSEHNAFYLVGDDGYWRDKVLDEFRSSVPDYARDMDLKTIYPLKNLDELEDAVSSFSVFGGRVTVLAGGYGAKGDGDGEISKGAAAQWARILDSLGTEVVLAIYDSKLPASVSKRMESIDCSKLDAQILKGYITELVKPRKIEFRALNMLVEYCNRDMARISNEILKLNSYCAEDATITAEDVDTLVANTTENEVYEFSNALADKNKARATELLARFLAKGTAYTYLLTLLINQYRRLLHCSLSKLSDEELAAVLGVKEFAVRKSRETAKKYSQSALKKILTLLVNAELAFKSGEMSDETAFKTAVAEITAM